MKEIYRIKKGELKTQGQIIPFDFGLIFEADGVFFFDFYVIESFDLNEFMINREKNSLYNYFTLSALTVENNKVEATNLSIRHVIPGQFYMKMQCHGFLKHTEVRVERNENKEDKRETLYYLEIEGLKMEFSDLTETIRARRGEKIKDFNGWERDHTSALLIYDSPTKFGCNNFQFTFFKINSSDNIYVELPNYHKKGPNVLHYDIYREFKRDLTFLLSLLNGAEVQIRKEFIGGFYNIGKVNSQTVITYSFKTIKNESYNQYIPLNNHFHLGENVIARTFLSCFNKYVEENKKLDLNSIIFYLNVAEQAISIEGKFFILIIAFERLAQKFIKTLNFVDSLILSEDDYMPIKNELLATLEKYRPTYKKAIDDLKGKIGELHKIKSTSTKYKFHKLLEYANISMSPEIEKIIDEVRHKTIHHGEIGSGQQGVKNFIVLDELLRDIILNIIGYDSIRSSRYRGKTKTPRAKAYNEKL